MGFYDYYVTDAKGNQISLKEYENKVVLVVNTATACGFTPQYEELEKLHEKYNAQGLEILDILTVCSPSLCSSPRLAPWLRCSLNCCPVSQPKPAHMAHRRSPAKNPCCAMFKATSLSTAYPLECRVTPSKV